MSCSTFKHVQGFDESKRRTRQFRDTKQSCIKQSKKEDSKQGNFRNNKPQHAPTIRLVHLLAVQPIQAFIDNLAKPAKHGSNQNGNALSQNVRPQCAVMQYLDKTQYRTEQSTRTHHRPE